MNQNLINFFPKENEIPEHFRLQNEISQKRVLIDGEFIEWEGPFQEVYSPIYTRSNSTDELVQTKLGSYPICTSQEAEKALQAALKAFNGGRGEWPSMSVSQRISAMENFIVKMVEQREKVVKLLVWEICKSYKDSEKEFDRTVDAIKCSIEALKELDINSSRTKSDEGVVAQVKKSPYGVVLCMGPYNYPLNETFATLIPALLMGNTVLFKPPRRGTLLFEPLLNAFKECFPKGVINTLYGRGKDVIPTLMQSGKINVLAFIGSSKVVNGMIKEHPNANSLHSVLGLDAKNAAIIDKTADIDLAVKEAILGTFSFNGQRCTALKILFVHSSIADEFNKKFIEEISKLKVGMPWEDNVTITPLAEPDKPQYVQKCIDEALENNGEIINKENGGGQILNSLVSPTVIYPANEKMNLLYNNEQFAPIIPIVPFDDLESPISYITNSTKGQQAAIFSNDEDTVSYLVDALCCQVGRININAQCQRGPDTLPFNGRKNSALGTLSTIDALYALSIDSVVATKDTKSNDNLIDSVIKSGKSSRLS